MKRLVLAVVLLLISLSSQTLAQVDAARVERLEQRVSHVEREVKDMAGVGLVLFLFGALCALWAQNTKRNAWLWFFFGLLTGPFAMLVLLYKNSADRIARLAQAESVP